MIISIALQQQRWRRRFTGAILIAVVAVAGGVRSVRAEPPLSRAIGEPLPTDTGFRLGLRIGFGNFMEPTVYEAPTWNGLTFQGDVGVRFDRHLEFGTYVGVAIVPNLCDGNYGYCATTDVRAGLSFAYHSGRFRDLDLWLGVEVGANVMGVGVFGTTRHASGAELAVPFGLDWYVSDHLAVGVFASPSVVVFVSTNEPEQWGGDELYGFRTSFWGGLRVVYDFGVLLERAPKPSKPWYMPQ